MRRTSGEDGHVKVFLSYSRRDSEFVDRLDRDLSSRGYQVWVDREDIVGGGEDRWRRSTVRAIHDSDVMVLVLSPNSVESEHVERELSVAADNRRRVVPVLLRECQIPHGFQYELAGLQYADFSTVGFDEAMHQLAAQLGQPTATGIEHPTSPSAPTHVRAPANAPGDVRRRQRMLLLLGACAVALVIGATLLAATLDDDDEASPDTVAPGPMSDTTVPDPTTTRAGTTTDASATTGTSTPTTAAPPSDIDQARALVMTWADATTRRDWAEAARIETSGTIVDYDTWYGGQKPMKSINPYIVSETPAGDLWILTGAVMAYDYDHPTLRDNITTNVVCSWWEVDLASGTAKWGFDPERVDRDDRQIPPEEFAEAYQRVCA